MTASGGKQNRKEQSAAIAFVRMHDLAMTTKDVVTSAAVRNAMILHAAFGGSTNLVLHLPAIAFHAGVQRPTAKDWAAVNKQVPRLVDALPNGPRGFATVQVFLAGGVPEVMLHLRRAELLDTTVRTVSGTTLDATLDWWQQSERRHELRRQLRENDGIDADDVIMAPDRARARHRTTRSTVSLLTGSIRRLAKLAAGLPPSAKPR